MTWQPMYAIRRVYKKSRKPWGKTIHASDDQNAEFTLCMIETSRTENWDIICNSGDVSQEVNCEYCLIEISSMRRWRAIQ